MRADRIPGALEEWQGLVGFLARAEADPERTQGEDVIGLELYHRRQAVSIASHLRSRKAAKASTWKPSAGLSLQLLCGRQHLPRRRAGRARQNHAHVGREHGDLSEAGPRGCVSRIEADGFLEGAHGPAEVLDPAKVPALQVAALGLDLVGLRSSVNGSRTGRNPRLQRVDDACCDLALNGGQ